MTEDKDIPKVEGEVSSSSQPTKTDSHEDNFEGAVKKAQDATEERIVESAGEKGGLQGRLSARMDRMSQALDSVSRNRIPVRKGLTHPIDRQARFTNDLLVRPTAKLLSRTTRLLRDRLQPSMDKTASPEVK